MWNAWRQCSFLKFGVENIYVFGMARIYEILGIHHRGRRIRAKRNVSEINIQKCWCSAEMAKIIYQGVHKKRNRMHSQPGRSLYVMQMRQSWKISTNRDNSRWRRFDLRQRRDKQIQNYVQANMQDDGFRKT